MTTSVGAFRCKKTTTWTVVQVGGAVIGTL